MADVMSTAVSGLLAFRRGLDTTSQNIANATTAGYSRQRVELATRPAQAFGSGWVGSGVQVTTVARVYDAFLASQVRSSASSLGRYDTLATEAERLDNVLGDSSSGLSAAFQNLVNAFQEVANDPSSLTSRQVLLSKAGIFTDQLAGYDSRLRAFAAEINTRLQAGAAEVSALADSLAKLNTQIVDAYGRTGQPPNDLLDQRDRLVDQLSSFVDVSVVTQDNGAANVYVGTGQPLVIGSTPTRLAVAPDPFDPTRLNLAIRSGATTTDISSQVTGGSLGGLLEYRAQILEPARDALGKVAAGVVAVVNGQHTRGITLTGAMGAPFFSIGSPTVLASAANGGNAAVSASIVDAGALTGDDYVFEFTGAWQLRNTTSGSTVALSGSGTVADPFTADGLSFVVGNTPVPGDKFRIEPTRDLVRGLGLALSDPAAIAAASPIRTAAGLANAGTGTISPPTVTDATDPALRNTVAIEFTSATTYSVNGAGSFAYTQGAPIALNGWSVHIDGAPVAGDRFTISDNSSGRGDNSNLLAMLGALEAPSLGGGTTSIADAAMQLTARIGTQTSQAQSNRDAFTVVHDQDIAAQQSVSGVNLDEEAANLIMLQQAFQAAAQLISVAQSMFDSLLGATRR
ncbi:MAG TPA: flagellar hook-associated protein FlgK [Steroidobacteraceae bacterium]|nr:flagellar hook-associated protein FlgK [Steroidobacteraceae bacterium]